MEKGDPLRYSHDACIIDEHVQLFVLAAKFLTESEDRGRRGEVLRELERKMKEKKKEKERNKETETKRQKQRERKKQ